MKKVFLSLATVAFVAAGTLTMTSCGSDDSTTTAPTPGGEDDTPGDGDELTDNYISVDGEQTAAVETRWYVRTNGNTGDSPIIEYTIKQGDTDKYAVYDLVTYGEDGAVFNVTYGVLVDASKTGEERYYYPFTSETFKTVLLDAVYVANGQDVYGFVGDDFKMQPTALDYSAQTMAYTASGTALLEDEEGEFLEDADDTSVEVDYDGDIKSMLIFDASQPAAKGVNNVFTKGHNLDFKSAGTILRK